MKVFTLYIFFFFSVSQAFFEKRVQESNAPSALKITCLFQCMKSSHCRAFKIDLNQTENICSIFNSTSGMMSQEVFRRIYPAPTPEGECAFHLFLIRKIQLLISGFKKKRTPEAFWQTSSQSTNIKF